MAAFDDRSGVVRLIRIPLALAGEKPKPVVIDRDEQVLQSGNLHQASKW